MSLSLSLYSTSSSFYSPSTPSSSLLPPISKSFLAVCVRFCVRSSVCKHAFVSLSFICVSVYVFVCVVWLFDASVCCVGFHLNVSVWGFTSHPPPLFSSNQHWKTTFNICIWRMCGCAPRFSAIDIPVSKFYFGRNKNILGFCLSSRLTFMSPRRFRSNSTHFSTSVTYFHAMGLYQHQRAELVLDNRLLLL